MVMVMKERVRPERRRRGPRRRVRIRPGWQFRRLRQATPVQPGGVASLEPRERPSRRRTDLRATRMYGRPPTRPLRAGTRFPGSSLHLHLLSSSSTLAALASPVGWAIDLLSIIAESDPTYRRGSTVRSAPQRLTEAGPVGWRALAAPVEGTVGSGHSDGPFGHRLANHRQSFAGHAL